MISKVDLLPGTTSAKFARPFVKWVGGKARLVPQMAQYFPETFGTYFEPFVGGGAVFFALRPEKSVLNDINSTLIHAYRDIQKHPSDLIRRLSSLQQRYYHLEADAQKALFYEIREQYNGAVATPIERTAELIFLNKTCFNGMYRENSKGGFNVPFANHARPPIADSENIIAISQLLERTVLLNGSYKDAIINAVRNDFVYFDPPYYPLNVTSSFTSYSKDNFLEQEQRELKNVFAELASMGVKVALSNSSAPFIKELYRDFRQEPMSAGRSINSKGHKRGEIEELLILSYES